MCGIVGILNLEGNGVPPELLGRMTKVLKHRGPDDEGYLLVDTSTGRYEPRSGDDTMGELSKTIKHLLAPMELRPELAFGHRRLSIIDISAAGHQPMSNEDGTIWIVHNGEIYNYIELRGDLKSRGHVFRSNTDTEVVIHSYEEWGLECLNRFNGMWAFAIWDGREKKLFCSRDRFGVKPFYYYLDSERFIFASEIKALLEAGFVERKPNEQIIFDYLTCALVDHTESTFFKDIKQLRGGHYLELHPGGNRPEIRRYYDIPLSRTSTKMTDEEYAKRFHDLFEDSVRLRLVSDVPVGSCLSGGLDSSSIVCVIDKLMSEQGVKFTGGEGMQRTFSARYYDKRHDEGRFIGDVVRKTAVDARYTYPTGKQLQEDLSALVWHQEEPFGSTSIYAQWEVFKLVKQYSVKVALDGQGGDELLAGYHGYFPVLFFYLIRTLQWLKLAREGLLYLITHGTSTTLNLLIYSYHRLRQTKRSDFGPWLSNDFAAKFKGQPLFPADDIKPPEVSLFDWFLYSSILVTSLPSLLKYEDRNSMAHSIESRVPFLDFRLVEFACALPWEQKIRRGTTKLILRNAMKGVIPDSVATRQDKIGFSTPEDAWFRGDLREDILEVINSQSFRQRPFFDHRKLLEEFKAHQQGQRNISAIIWRWVNLELWLRRFID